ncbi:MAG: YceI family protein [Phycisphaerales bacterium]|jgi:polyisoprenoid-binding protein YceI|nr:YceI family protein [Phycisphaeraceae bacterium]
MRICPLCVVGASAGLVLLGAAGLMSLDRAITSPAQAAAQASAAQSAAASGPFDIDAVHSSVVFRIKHLSVANFYGMFEKISGKFHIDPANLDKSMIEATVDVASIDSNNKDRDQHLLSDSFFAAKEFPTMTFKSTKFTKTGENTFDVAGELTLLGKTRPVTTKVEFTGQGPGRPPGSTVAGLEARLEFKRSDFGMSYMLAGLSDEVGLIVALEGIRK